MTPLSTRQQPKLIQSFDSVTGRVQRCPNCQSTKIRIDTYRQAVPPPYDGAVRTQCVDCGTITVRRYTVDKSHRKIWHD